MSCLDEALRYAGRGWHVLPLHYPSAGVCSCGKSGCSSLGKHPRTKNGLTSATTDAEQIRAWWKAAPLANVGIRTGRISGLCVLDVDGDEGKASLQALQEQHGTLPHTLRALTGRAGDDGKRKGCHYFFQMPEGVELRNSASVLGKGLDIRGEGGYVVAAPSLHASGHHYQWIEAGAELAELPVWLLERLEKPRGASMPLPASPARASSMPEESFGEGGRNAGLTKLGGKLRADGLTAPELESALLAANRVRCIPPLPDSEVRQIAQSVSRYAPKPSSVVRAEAEEAAKPARNWPTPMGGDAYYGVAGEFVALISPHTEADQAALLVQCLVALGSIIGRGPYYRVSAERHYLNLFAVCVAESSKGRKGTSWNEVHAFCKLVDIEWWCTRVSSGLSTGEGLIHAVRDAITEAVPIKEKGKVIETQEQVTDQGVKDKRLLCVEGELGQALQCAGREGNTLSPIVRLAWDGKRLRVMTRGAKGECAEPHISIIGHITNTELQTLLTTNDVANGFANRFLWVGVARSKCLPFGGMADPEEMGELARRTREAVTKAREIQEVTWASETRDAWEKAYSELSAGGHGMLGSVTARAEAQVVRLATLYAVLDGCAEIRLVHLRAALELWRYCYDSAAFIFGTSLGDPVCDGIVALLRTKPDGATRTEISEHFDRNKTKAQLDTALSTLQSRGMIRSAKRETGGRAAEVWQLVSV